MNSEKTGRDKSNSLETRISTMREISKDFSIINFSRKTSNKKF